MLLPEPAVFGYASIITDKVPFVKGFLKNIFNKKTAMFFANRRLGMNILSVRNKHHYVLYSAIKDFAKVVKSHGGYRTVVL